MKNIFNKSNCKKSNYEILNNSILEYKVKMNDIEVCYEFNLTQKEYEVYCIIDNKEEPYRLNMNEFESVSKEIKRLGWL